MFLFLGLAIFCVHSLSLTQFLILSCASFTLVFYERVISQFHLRKIPYTKPFIISFTWATLCTFFHIEDIQNLSNLFVNFLDCFALILLLCLALDYRDIKEDSSHHIQTLATESNPKKYLKTIAIFFFIYQCLN